MDPPDEKEDEEESERDEREGEGRGRAPAKDPRRRHAGATTPLKKGRECGWSGGIFVYPVGGNNPFHLVKAAV